MDIIFFPCPDYPKGNAHLDSRERGTSTSADIEYLGGKKNSIWRFIYGEGKDTEVSDEKTASKEY